MVYDLQAEGFVTPSEVVEIRIADAADVTAIGGTLVVGDILVEHALLQPGGDDPQPGDTFIILGSGLYNGIRIIDKVLVQGAGTNYLTIVSPNYGDVTPAVFGSISYWPPGYTFYLQLSIYTDPDGPPQLARLQATPDTLGRVRFDVSTVLRNYFSSDISPFAVEVSGLLQSAHGTTAIFYTSEIAEVWRDPEATEAPNPFDGDHTVHEDEENLTAVNAIHDYASPILNWGEADMSKFEMGTVYSRFLTNKNRNGLLIPHTFRTGERLRLHMLTGGGLNIILRFYNYASEDATPTETDYPISLAGNYAAFSLACGPADLSPIFSLAYKYRVELRKVGTLDLISEQVEVILNYKCRETYRRFLWLGKLGGVEQYTFSGREVATGKYKRATVQKPMGRGTGYDWAEKVYRNEPERTRMISTIPLRDDVRRWVAEDLCESPSVAVEVEGQICPCIVLSSSIPAWRSDNGNKPITIEYKAGVDNMSQQG